MHENANQREETRQMAGSWAGITSLFTKGDHQRKG